MVDEMPTLPGLNSPLEEGEPTFTLRARDSLAPHMAALWAAVYSGDTASAVVLFADLIADPGYKHRHEMKTSEKFEKIRSASAKANEMNEWRGEHGLEIFSLHTVK